MYRYGVGLNLTEEQRNALDGQLLHQMKEIVSNLVWRHFPQGDELANWLFAERLVVKGGLMHAHNLTREVLEAAIRAELNSPDAGTLVGRVFGRELHGRFMDEVLPALKSGAPAS